MKAGCKGDANMLRPTLMCTVPLILERKGRHYSLSCHCVCVQRKFFCEVWSWNLSGAFENKHCKVVLNYRYRINLSKYVCEKKKFRSKPARGCGKISAPLKKKNISSSRKKDDSAPKRPKYILMWWQEDDNDDDGKKIKDNDDDDKKIKVNDGWGAA